MTTSNLSTLVRSDVSVPLTALPTTLIAPTLGTQLTNKDYVDTAIGNASLNAYKIYVSAVTVATTNITLSGLQTINGKLTAVGDLVLATAQTDQKVSLGYIAQTGPWTLAPGYETGKNLANVLVNIRDGNLKGASYVVTSSPAVVGTDNIVWTPVNFAINTDSSLTETTGSIGESVLGLNVSEIIPPPPLTTNATPLTFASQNISIVKTYRLQPTAPTTFNITPPVTGQIGAKIEVINESFFDVTIACAGATFVGSPVIPAGTSPSNYLGQGFRAYSPTSIGVG